MLLVACAIGLATGAGVVLFNDIIHAIRHLAWQVGVCCLLTCWIQLVYGRWACCACSAAGQLSALTGHLAR